MNEPEYASASRGVRILALVIGAVVSGLLSAALVIATAKAGISPGVSPLVVLFGWIGLGATLGPRLRPFLAQLQVTGSGGAAVSAGVVFTAPIAQIFAQELGIKVPPVDISTLIVASMAGSFIGWGFVGLATERFLNDPKLPAPEAVACDRLIQTAAEHPDRRPPVVSTLLPGLGLGIGLKGLLQYGWLPGEVARLKWLPSFGGISTPIPINPVFLGIGALLTLPTALLIFGGSAIHSLVTGYSTAKDLPDDTFRWVGGAAMCVAVVWNLVWYALDGRKRGGSATPTGAAALVSIPPAQRKRQYAAIGVGSVGLLVLMGMLGAGVGTIVAVGAVAVLLAAFLSGLGALLSLQVGASASPVSGTTFMGMLVLSLTGLGVGLSGSAGVELLIPVVVATCVAVCAANDASQDYKTVQLNGYRVSDHLGGQIIGLLVGAVVVPVTLAIAHQAGLDEAAAAAAAQGLASPEYGGLGSDSLPCPQATFFSTVLASLFVDRNIPAGPVAVGALLGVGGVLLEEFGRRKGMILSSLALAVGIYLPAEIGAGILLGAAARFAASGKVRAGTHTGILTAAGLITGYAFTALLVGLVVVFGFGDAVTRAIGAPGWYPNDHLVPRVIGGILLSQTLALVWWNYRRKWTPEAPNDEPEARDA